MDDEVAIRVEKLSKSFKLPHEKHGSLKNMFVNIFRGRTTYEKQEVLKDISLEIKKGEFFGIVGRNGSGKSTLLKLLAGVYSPESGAIHVNGKLTPFIELGVGFSPELTGRENVFLNGSLLGFSREEMEKMYDEIVEFAELERFMDQKLKNYSSGMQVRLAFSIAIRAESEILLLDEVLAVGDSNFQRKCFRTFKEIKNQGRTVVLVTHDMDAIQEYCNRALMISSGKIVLTGKPRDVALRYEAANSGSSKTNKENKLMRPKNPGIKIESLIIESQNKKTSQFTLDDEIRITANVNVKTATEAQFNLFLLNKTGDYLAGINSTKHLGTRFDRGKQSFTCSIKAGQLAKGEYSVGLGIYTMDSMPEIIDIVDKNYSAEMPNINIIESSKFRNGQFYIDGQWLKD